MKPRLSILILLALLGTVACGKERAKELVFEPDQGTGTPGATPAGPVPHGYPDRPGGSR
jgi:hypothetical protein